MNDAKPITIKYPLPCGCSGPRYVSKCLKHQREDQLAHAKHLGTSDPPHCATCECEKPNEVAA